MCEASTLHPPPLHPKPFPHIHRRQGFPDGEDGQSLMSRSLSALRQAAKLGEADMGFRVWVGPEDYWAYVGILEKKVETTVVYWGYEGIVGKKMETTVVVVLVSNIC